MQHPSPLNQFSNISIIVSVVLWKCSDSNVDLSHFPWCCTVCCPKPHFEKAPQICCLPNERWSFFLPCNRNATLSSHFSENVYSSSTVIFYIESWSCWYSGKLHMRRVHQRFWNLDRRKRNPDSSDNWTLHCWAWDHFRTSLL